VNIRLVFILLSIFATCLTLLKAILNELLRGSDEGQKKRESNPIPTISQFAGTPNGADLAG